MKKIVISLTDFINYVNTVGTSRMTLVKSLKNKSECMYDYYRQLREGIVRIHKNGEPRSSLDKMLEEFRYKDNAMKENYYEMVSGYKKFWGRNSFTWVNPPKEVWTHDNLDIRINPELGLSYLDKYKDSIYIIKLYFKKDKHLNKREKDMFLDLMYYNLPKELKCKEVKVSLLDVQTGKIATKIDTDIPRMPLLKSEAVGLIDLWYNLDK